VQVEVEVLSYQMRKTCPECFVLNPRTKIFSFHARKELAGQEIPLMVKYTDGLGGKSSFPFFIEVDPLPEIEPSQDKPDPDENRNQTDNDSKDIKYEDTVEPELTPEQSYLKEWKETNKFGYLLSGEVLVT